MQQSNFDRRSEEIAMQYGGCFNLDFASGAGGTNPSAIYAPGVLSRSAIDGCRQRIAAILGAEPEEIFFTSGGTESNNWALKGTAEALLSKGKRHIITSCIEHPSVLESCHYLEGGGFEVTYLPVNRWGQVDPHELEVSIRNDTGLVSIMALSNEIGTRQNIPELASIAHAHGLVFHSDCVQHFPHYRLNVHDPDIDLASISGHKFGAPVGVGILYVRKGTPILPLLHGGGQQGGFRSGTESVELVERLTNAMEETVADLEHRRGKAYRAGRALFSAVQGQFPSVLLNGAPAGAREPSIINLCFPGVDGETLVQMLDAEGVFVSRGSACSAGEHHPSHVLKAIGLSDEDAMSSIRVSIPPDLSVSEAEEAGRRIGVAALVLEDMA